MVYTILGRVVRALVVFFLVVVLLECQQQLLRQAIPGGGAAPEHRTAMSRIVVLPLPSSITADTANRFLGWAGRPSSSNAVVRLGHSALQYSTQGRWARSSSPTGIVTKIRGGGRRLMTMIIVPSVTAHNMMLGK